MHLRDISPLIISFLLFTQLSCNVVEKKDEKKENIKFQSVRSFSMVSNIAEDSYTNDLEFYYKNPSEEAFDDYLNPDKNNDNFDLNKKKEDEITPDEDKPIEKQSVTKTEMEKFIESMEFVGISNIVRVVLKYRKFILNGQYNRFINKAFPDVGLNLAQTGITFLVKNKYAKFALIIGRFSYEEYGKKMKDICYDLILLIIKILISALIKKLLKKTKLNILFIAALHGVATYYANEGINTISIGIYKKI